MNDNFHKELAMLHPTIIESEIIMPAIEQVIDDYQNYIDDCSEITDVEDIEKHKKLVSSWKAVRNMVKTVMGE